MSLISLYRCPVCEGRGHHPECEESNVRYPLLIKEMKPGLVVNINEIKLPEVPPILPSWRLVAALLGIISECTLTPELEARYEKAVADFFNSITEKE